MSHERSQSTFQPLNQSARRSGRPVVIRPMQPLEGTPQNVRVDAPQSIPGPHRRIERLEEYVSWLQQQSLQQSQQPAKQKLVPSFDRELPAPAPVKLKSEPAPIARSLSPKELLDDKSFSQPPAAPKPQPVAKSNKPIIEFVNKADESNRARFDQAHAQPEARFAPAPKTPANQFQLEADLERILRKLETAEQDLRQIPSSPVADDTTRLQSAFAPTPPARKMEPAEFAQPYAQEVSPSPDTDRELHSDRLTRSEIIQTISAAIASVLTNQAEPIIEAKIKQQLKDLQLELVPDSEPVFESGINEPKGDDRHDAVSEQQPKAQAGRSTRPVEIPVSVAAWDVGEFRWPKVTDQMISLGADAIGQLSTTILGTIAGTRRRVAITAADRRSGTTSIAISLARWAANEGGRVLLVDADLAHPELSSLVGLGPGISWLNALRDPRAFQNPAEYIIRSQNFPICIMPLALSVDKSRESHRLDRLGQLLDPVSFDFDLILLDMGPASQIVSELSLGANLMDTALIVHQDKGYKVNQVQNQLRELEVEQFVFAQNAASQTRSNVA